MRRRLGRVEAGRSLAQLLELGPVGVADLDQFFAFPLVGGVVRLQRFNSLDTNARNQPDSVIDGSACSVAVALLSLCVDVVLVETQM